MITWQIADLECSVAKFKSIALEGGMSDILYSVSHSSSEIFLVSF